MSFFEDCEMALSVRPQNLDVRCAVNIMETINAFSQRFRIEDSEVEKEEIGALVLQSGVGTRALEIPDEVSAPGSPEAIVGISSDVTIEKLENESVEGDVVEARVIYSAFVGNDFVGVTKKTGPDHAPAFCAINQFSQNDRIVTIKAHAKTKKEALFKCTKLAALVISIIQRSLAKKDREKKKGDQTQFKVGKGYCPKCDCTVTLEGHVYRCRPKEIDTVTKYDEHLAYIGDRSLGVHWGWLLLEGYKITGDLRLGGQIIPSIGTVVSYAETKYVHKEYLASHEPDIVAHFDLVGRKANAHTWSTVFESKYAVDGALRRRYWETRLKGDPAYNIFERVIDRIEGCELL